jgi:hypothetical protein
LIPPQSIIYERRVNGTIRFFDLRFGMTMMITMASHHSLNAVQTSFFVSFWSLLLQIKNSTPARGRGLIGDSAPRSMIDALTQRGWLETYARRCAARADICSPLLKRKQSQNACHIIAKLWSSTFSIHYT